jgi:hypothetical protein
MFIVGLLSWWYGAGWVAQAKRVQERIAATVDYFSISLLLSTLFSPFRQISAGRVGGPLTVRWQAFVDRLISRCIGAVVRLVMIVLGCITIIAISCVGAISLMVWAIIPLLPIIGAALTIIGWVPVWM